MAKWTCGLWESRALNLVIDFTRVALVAFSFMMVFLLTNGDGGRSEPAQGDSKNGICVG